jgi:hypothetical protein
MLPKPSYASYYKFLVSVGLVLLAVALGAPLLLLREPFDFLITVEELGQLTDTAQQAISDRQQLGSSLSRAIPVVSLVLAVAGIALTTWGLRRWSQRQQVQDELEDTALVRARVEVRSLTATEVQAKRQDEVEQVLVDTAARADSTSGSPRPAVVIGDRKELMMRIANIELAVAAALSELPDYRVEAGVAIESGPFRENVDLLLRSNRFDIPDLLVEVNYAAQPKTVWNRFRDLAGRLERTRLLYQQSSGRSAEGLGILVIAEDVDRWARLDEALLKARAEATLLRYKVRLAVVREASLHETSRDQWAAVVQGSSIYERADKGNGA